MKIYKIDEILSKLKNCIEERKPFSHIRFGDGGIKMLASLFEKNIGHLEIISKKEGIPLNKMVYVAELWGYYARRADFIDTPEVYFNKEFWPRIKKYNEDGEIKQISERTLELLLMWPDIYYNAEFDNFNFCNPESNYLLITRKDGENLLDIMENKKICIITAKPQVRSNLKDLNTKIDIFTIAGHYQEHYNTSFNKTIEFIKSMARYYDLFLVAGGELGRIYSGVIKESGGRAIDIGFVIEFWCGLELHPRLTYFLKRNPNNPLELILTDKGKEYERFI